MNLENRLEQLRNEGAELFIKKSEENSNELCQQSEIKSKIYIGGRYNLKPVIKTSNVQKFLNKKICKNYLGRIKHKEETVTIEKKDVKECDVQTNDLGYDFIIVDNDI